MNQFPRYEVSSELIIQILRRRDNKEPPLVEEHGNLELLVN